jgi:hypothetical protein
MTTAKTTTVTNQEEDQGAQAIAKFWADLTARFPDDQVEKLPKPVRARDDDRGTCERGSRYSADGHYCGKYHARAVHLDYIGHAGITTRLNEVCGPDGWDWEPLVTDERGFPVMTDEFWIVLRIRRPDGEWVTKKGVGDDFNRSSKQAIGDALRNAAMRFGIATYLWSKSDAAAAQAENIEPPPVDRSPEAKALWAKAEQTAMFEEIRGMWAEANARGLLEVEIEHMDGAKELLGDALRRRGDLVQTAGA